MLSWVRIIAFYGLFIFSSWVLGNNCGKPLKLLSYDSIPLGSVVNVVRNEVPAEKAWQFLNPKKNNVYAKKNRGWARVIEFKGIAGKRHAYLASGHHKAVELEELIGFRVRTESRAGSLVAVKRADKTIDVGEVIQLRDGRVLLRMGKAQNGKNIYKWVPLSLLAELNSGMKKDSHITIANPSSLPDGIRFPTRGTDLTGFTGVIDRRNDPYLKQFLSENLPELEGKGFKEKVDSVLNTIRKEMTFAEEDAQDINTDRYFQNIFWADEENRGLFIGEAWQCKRGVCKDYALLATILLGDSGVATRYVKGSVISSDESGGHSWFEFQNPKDGKWYAVNPNWSDRPKPVEEFYRKRPRAAYHEKLRVNAQISGY